MRKGGGHFKAAGMAAGMAIAIHRSSFRENKKESEAHGASSRSTSGIAPLARHGRAFSEVMLGIRENMSRWQIARTVALAILAVTLIMGATMHYHLPLMYKISEFYDKMPVSPLSFSSMSRTTSGPEISVAMVFARHDDNGDGSVDEREAMGMLAALGADHRLKFQSVDSNNDGKTTVVEWQKLRGLKVKGEILEEELVQLEQQTMEWHEKLWKFRTEIISTIALVNMDDEEEFELEALDNNANTSKWRWLTFHLIGHVALIIIAHVYDSWLFTMTAMYSQGLFLLLFVKSKRLGDAVSSSISVVRKSARNVGTQVSVASSERTLLQFQVLQNKMDFLTDMHEAHQLGMGFFVPFVGTLDVDLDTLLSLSVGCMFELIVLILTRINAEMQRRRSQAQEATQQEGDSMMRDNMADLRYQVGTLQKQVKGKLDELEMLMITSRQRQPSDECELMNALNVTPPSSNCLRKSRELISQAVSPPSSNPLEQTFRNFLRCDTLSDEDEDPSFNVDRTKTRTKKRTNPDELISKDECNARLQQLQPGAAGVTNSSMPNVASRNTWISKQVTYADTSHTLQDSSDNPKLAGGGDVTLLGGGELASDTPSPDSVRGSMRAGPEDGSSRGEGGGCKGLVDARNPPPFPERDPPPSDPRHFGASSHTAAPELCQSLPKGGGGGGKAGVSERIKDVGGVIWAGISAPLGTRGDARQAAARGAPHAAVNANMPASALKRQGKAIVSREEPEEGDVTPGTLKIRTAATRKFSKIFAENDVKIPPVADGAPPAADAAVTPGNAACGASTVVAVARPPAIASAVLAPAAQVAVDNALNHASDAATHGASVASGANGASSQSDLKQSDSPAVPTPVSLEMRTPQERKGAGLLRSVLFPVSASSSVPGEREKAGWSWEGIRQRVKGGGAATLGDSGFKPNAFSAAASAPPAKQSGGATSSNRVANHIHGATESRGGSGSKDAKVYGGGSMPAGFYLEDGHLKQKAGANTGTVIGSEGCVSAVQRGKVPNGDGGDGAGGVGWQDQVESHDAINNPLSLPSLSLSLLSSRNSSSLGSQGPPSGATTTASMQSQTEALTFHSLRWQEEHRQQSPPSPPLSTSSSLSTLSREGVANRAENSIELMFQQLKSKDQHTSLLKLPSFDDAHEDQAMPPRRGAVPAARLGGAEARPDIILRGPFGGHRGSDCNGRYSS